MIVIQKKQPKADLQLQLLALYLLFVGPIFVLAVLFFFNESQRLHEDITAADLSLARAIALETNAVLERAEGAVLAYSQMPAVIEADPRAMEPLFAAGVKARQDVNLFYRLSQDGIMLFHYPPGSDPTIGQDFSFRDYFQRARETQSHVFSKGRISPTTGRPVVTSVMPIVVNGEFDGVVAVNLELQQLSETLQQISEKRPPNEKVNIMMVDSAGQVIVHSNPDQLLENLSDEFPILETVLSGDEGSVTGSSRGEEWLYSYTPIPAAGWSVVVQHPTRLAFGSLINFQRGLILALVIFGIGAVLFWLILSNRVIIPLAQLTKYGESVSRQIAGTEFLPESIEPLAQRQDQIGQLSRTLLRAEGTIRQRLMELITLNKTSAAVVSTLDTEKVIDAILDEVQSLLQVRQCTLLVSDENCDKVKVRASRGLSHHYLTWLAKTDPTKLPAYQAILSRQLVQVPDIEAEAELAEVLPLAQAEGFRSVLAIPLLAPHVLPSALVIYREDVHHFSNQEISLVASFANHAAIALEHAILFKLTDAQLQQQVQFLSALNKVGHVVSQSLDIDDVLNNAMDAVFEVMPIDACWICLRRPTEAFLRLRAQRGLPKSLVEQMENQVIHFGEGVLGQVAQSGVPLLLDEATMGQSQWSDDVVVAHGGWRLLAAAPLSAKDAVMGVLGVTSRTETDFTGTKVELLEAIGDQIAIAVMNARLYRRSREAATLEERNRVAREIHDTLAQGFTGILIQLQAAERLSLKRPEKAIDSLQEARELARQSLQEARRSVLNLRPTVLENLPLDQAIAQQVEQFTTSTGLRADFTLEGYPSTLEAEIEQNLYRITQEALTNIKRHAQASQINVMLAFDPKTVTLSITDDGIGLEQSIKGSQKSNGSNGRSSKHSGGGFGLVGIQERANLMGGQVTFGSPETGGTQVKVVVSK